jgi:UDP-N-acetylmuramyl pentapeptide synthase
MGGLNFTAGDVALATGGRLISGSREHREQRIGGIAIDSRQVKPGDLFIALKGKGSTGTGLSLKQ